MHTKPEPIHKTGSVFGGFVHTLDKFRRVRARRDSFCGGSASELPSVFVCVSLCLCLSLPFFLSLSLSLPLSLTFTLSISFTHFLLSPRFPPRARARAVSLCACVRACVRVCVCVHACMYVCTYVHRLAVLSGCRPCTALIHQMRSHSCLCVWYMVCACVCEHSSVVCQRFTARILSIIAPALYPKP